MTSEKEGAYSVTWDHERASEVFLTLRGAIAEAILRVAERADHAWLFQADASSHGDDQEEFKVYHQHIQATASWKTVAEALRLGNFKRDDIRSKLSSCPDIKKLANFLCLVPLYQQITIRPLCIRR
jgi:hypothetical protein